LSKKFKSFNFVAETTHITTNMTIKIKITNNAQWDNYIWLNFNHRMLSMIDHQTTFFWLSNFSKKSSYWGVKIKYVCACTYVVIRNHSVTNAIWNLKLIFLKLPDYIIIIPERCIQRAYLSSFELKLTWNQRDTK
jgi:hypothetical protein